MGYNKLLADSISFEALLDHINGIQMVFIKDAKFNNISYNNVPKAVI